MNNSISNQKLGELDRDLLNSLLESYSKELDIKKWSILNP